MLQHSDARTKSKGTITKYALAKKLQKKGLTVNNKVSFDDDDDDEVISPFVDHL